MVRCILAAGSIVSAAGRERIKRQMSIGEHPGENDLSANEFSVKTYIHVNGEKYAVTFSHGEVFTSIPGRVIIRDTLEQLRDAVIAALAAKPNVVSGFASGGIPSAKTDYLAAEMQAAINAALKRAVIKAIIEMINESVRQR